jgi:PAS domain-containing protein
VQGPLQADQLLETSFSSRKIMNSAEQEKSERTGRLIQQKQIEQALRENERQFHTLANSIPQLAWMADREG